MNVPSGSPSNRQAMPPDRPDPNTMNVRQESVRRPDVRGARSRPPAGLGEAARAEELRSRLPVQGSQTRDVITTLLKAMDVALQSEMFNRPRNYALKRLIEQLDLIRPYITTQPDIDDIAMRDLRKHTEKALLLLRKVVYEEFVGMSLRAAVSGVGKGSEEFDSEEQALLNRERELRSQWNELLGQSPKIMPELEEAIGPLVNQLGALTTFWNKWLVPRND
jgi:hypothetical protein